MSDTDTIERPKAPQSAAKGAAGAGFAVERDAFLAAIRTAGQVVETRNTIPILSNLALRAEGDRLAVLGTDLDMLVEVEASCSAAGVFETTVLAARLQSAIDTLRPGRIDVTIDGGQLLMRQGSATRRLPVLPISDFPRIQTGDVACDFEIEAGTLLGLLNATSPSISTEETRYYLNGVFLHTPDKQTLRAASTDGARLARASTPLPKGAEGMPDIIVARKSVGVLRRLLDDVDSQASVPIEVSANKLAAKVGQTRVVAKLIDGTFPDYTQTIPTQNRNVLTVHVAEFVRCVRAAAAICGEKTRGIRLELDESGSRVVGNSPEFGQAVEPLDGEFATGALLVGLNARFAQDAAGIFGEAATLTIAFGDPRAPVLFTSTDRPALLAVLMPMNA